jgi:endonuclease G
MSTLRKGYDPDFLGMGINLPMPQASLELEDDVLLRDTLRDGYIVDYIHYSVVMGRFNKQAMFSAANLDQSETRQVRGRKWFVDPRIGLNAQIGPEAYARNDWDRGHLTRRTAVTWGTVYEAKRASNDSCSYANSSLQHANFNQDEWRIPENVVRDFDKDLNNRLCVFTGPVFTNCDRWFFQRGMTEKVRIPSGFWKVVAYIDKESQTLACQAYVMYQDSLFLADKRGYRSIKAKSYQVTITEVEKLTGLEFPQELYDSNPLYYYPRKDINEDGPEAFRVPRNAEEMKDGVVFSREDAQREPLLARRRILPPETVAAGPDAVESMFAGAGPF